MTGWGELDRFLRTDPRDVGCDQALHILHVYVELVLDDASGAEAARRYPVSPHTCSAAARAPRTTRTAPGRPSQPGMTRHLQARR
jgi:hypothetical protein